MYANECDATQRPPSVGIRWYSIRLTAHYNEKNQFRGFFVVSMLFFFFFVEPTCDTSVLKMAGSEPEKSVGEPTNIWPLSVIKVVILACGLKEHLATPLSNRVTFKLSI